MGLADLYPLSWCLLMAKLNGTLPEFCFDAGANVTLTRFMHHGAKRDLGAMPREVCCAGHDCMP